MKRNLEKTQVTEEERNGDYKVMKTKEMPLILTVEECDDYIYVVFSNEYDFINLYRAQKFVKQSNGILYTQIDGEKDRVYSKGIHFVNRTGIYLVVYDFNPSKRYIGLKVE